VSAPALASRPAVLSARSSMAAVTGCTRPIVAVPADG
jgi:hypothetical protein